MNYIIFNDEKIGGTILANKNKTDDASLMSLCYNKDEILSHCESGDKIGKIDFIERMSYFSQSSLIYDVRPLWSADTFKALAEEGIDITNKTALLTALKTNCFEVVNVIAKKMIEEGTWNEWKINFDCNFFAVPKSIEDFDIAKFLGFSINYHETFQYAINMLDINFIKHIEETGVKMNYIDSKIAGHLGRFFEFDLTDAINGRNQDSDFFEELPADSGICDYNDNAFLVAVKNGNMELIKYFLLKGADIHTGSNQALLLAIKYGHNDVLSYLINNGIDYRTRLRDCFIAAVKSKNFYVINLLARKPSDVKPYVMEVLLDIVRDCKGDLSMIVFLLSLGISFKKQSSIEMLECIIDNSDKNLSIQLLDLLSKYGLDIHMDNERLLFVMLLEKNDEIVKYLLSTGADIYAGDNYIINAFPELKNG